MRIRIDNTAIFEIREVYVTPGGMSNEDNPNKYHDMICTIDMRYGDGEWDCISGEFDCTGATTFEEAESVAMPFMNELFEKGYIDISTDEKCEKYGITIW